MVTLGRVGFLGGLILVGCSVSSEEWGGRIYDVDGVHHVENPTAPLTDPGAITASLLWSSTGPVEGDYWEAPNWVHADDHFLLIVDRQASKVHRLSLDGEPIPGLGEPGEGPGQYRRIVDAIPSKTGIFVVDGGNGRVEIRSPDGEVLVSSALGQIVFSVVPLGQDAIAISGMLGRDTRWQRIDATGDLADLDFPEFLDPDTAEITPTRPWSWHDHPVRLRFTSPTIQIFSPTGDLETVYALPLPVEEATDAEIETLVSEMASVMAEDGLPSGVIQQQAERVRARPRAKFRFREVRFDDSSGLIGIWEQNPEDFGSGNASLHLLSLDGIYLGVLGFDRAWSSFDLRDGVLYALSRNPGTDLVTLQAFSILVPREVLTRATRLAGSSRQ